MLEDFTQNGRRSSVLRVWVFASSNPLEADVNYSHRSSRSKAGVNVENE